MDKSKQTVALNLQEFFVALDYTVLPMACITVHWNIHRGFTRSLHLN